MNDQQPVEPAQEAVRRKEEELEAARQKARKPKTRQRTVQAKAGAPRPCKGCQKTISPKDPRTKYCHDCAQEAAAKAGREKGGAPALDRQEVEDALKPFLRLGCNLKEACLEAGYSYSNIVEKKNEWEGFAEFVERHKGFIVTKAKRNLFAIVSDPKHKDSASLTKFILETRAKDEDGRPEFQKSIDVTTKGEPIIPPPIPEQQQGALASLLAWRKKQ